MALRHHNYGYQRVVDLSYEEAVARVTETLKKEGFGVLTEIDVKEALKKKLGIDMQRYIILGACNPPFAHQALQAEEEISLLLPCNVIVYENKAGKTVISAMDPEAVLKLVENPTVGPVAKEVTMRLTRALEAV